MATIAAKEDRGIGSVVAEALEKVGPEGVVNIEEGDEPGVSVRFVEGVVVENGMLSPYMIRDPRADGDGLREPVGLHDQQAASSTRTT